MKHFLLLAFLLVNSPKILANDAALLKASEGQLQFVQNIGQVAPSLNVEAYERELKYLKQGLTLEEKVRHEVNLIAQAIRQKVVQSYELEFERAGNEDEARASVAAAIQRDLELADEDMRDDLLKIAEEALDHLTQGPHSSEISLTKLEEVMKDNISKREAYLLSEARGNQKRITRAEDFNSEVEFQNFSSKASFVNALVKEDHGSRWFRTASTTLRVGEGREVGATVALQVKIEFLGVSVEAGPRINFRREYNTTVNILADGLAPVLNPNGTFNFFEKDAQNRSTNKRRFIAFYCDASLAFRTEYEGRGGFKVAGMGADTSLKKDYSNQVQLNSRRLHVPEVVGGKKVDLNFLSRICLSDFLNAKINSQVRVKDSLNIMMKNVVSGLRFSHPDTQCVRDSHCTNWFNREVVGILRNKATARCVQTTGAQFVCALRGTQGQACTVIEKGKRTSSGMGEYICDKGLRCVKTRNEGWFQGGRLYQPSAGVCR